MAAPEFTIEELANEHWLPILGFEEAYYVSDLGRIRRYRIRRGCLVSTFVSPVLTVYGYHQVSLSINGIIRTRLIHRLVMETFAPHSIKETVNHLDGNKTNNRLSNLEWATSLENSQHASRTRLLAFGARNARATHPDTTARGDKNGSRLHPERLARGNRHGSRTKPEKVPRGDNHPLHKLTADMVLSIRKEYVPFKTGYRFLANKYGVTVHTIGAIIQRRLWKHI